MEPKIVEYPLGSNPPKAELYYGIDVLEGLKLLPGESVHTVCTSPPFWGLRDYNVEGQIGLGETPEEYVAKMVEVFREVKRVLRDDGTVWLNLGSSYAFGGMSPNQSPLVKRGLACDSDGKESQCSLTDDRVCLDLYDERQGGTRSRRGDNAHNNQCGQHAFSPLSQTSRDSELLGSVVEPHAASHSGVQVSTIQRSSDRFLDAFGHEAKASASQKEPMTSVSDVPLSSHTALSISDTSHLSPPLVVRTQGKESFFSACGSPSCQGIGRCGLCWCSLAIPSLHVKPKDEINIPFMVAFALQADGWVCRSTVIWAKPNPMPESVKDRPTGAHEYVFLLSKSATYFYDSDAIREASGSWVNKDARYQVGAVSCARLGEPSLMAPVGTPFTGMARKPSTGRNKRTVWTVSSRPYPGAHFAVWPPELVEPMILAGSPKGGTVLDPFSGSATTGLVALKHGRDYIGIDLNADYLPLAEARISGVKPPRAGTVEDDFEGSVLDVFGGTDGP